MIFRHETFISFHLVDSAGVLFFGHVFTLAHEAYENFVCKQLNYPWKEWFQNKEWLLPIGHAEADYRSPLFAGQTCQINVRTGEIKNSSFAMHYQFIQNNIECCSVKTVHVLCDPRTKRKRDIPASLRKILLNEGDQPLRP
jgi:1,4-dihydroxy-2-naphthoyl-CoA hydrolase